VSIVNLGSKGVMGTDVERLDIKGSMSIREVDAR
jgi:hypothetical protein